MKRRGTFKDIQYKRTYHAWYNMRWRCAKTEGYYYERYGARGITVCKRWENFGTFIKDMGLAPEGMTLDRINNDKGYRPSNCRWATWETQANNRCLSHPFTYKGESLSSYQWARRLGVPRHKIYTRRLTYEQVIQRIASLQS